MISKIDYTLPGNPAYIALDSTGHGSKSQDLNPWANSNLEISAKLNRYHSIIEASKDANPFDMTITTFAWLFKADIR